jgi:hypothetical protein
MVRNLWIYILCFSFVGWGRADTPVQFSLDRKKDAVLSGTGAVLLGIGYYFYLHVNPPDPGSLDRKRLMPLDRFAIHCRNRNTETISHVTLGICSMLPLIPLSQENNNRQIESQVLMTFESYLLNLGLSTLMKGIVKRPRPYAYRTENTLLDKRASRSFFSFHSSAAFNGAVLSAMMFQERNPDSPWVAPLWIAGLGTAAATGIFRVTSGNHFPTDILAGALVGSIVGIGIVRLHE